MWGGPLPFESRQQEEHPVRLQHALELYVVQLQADGRSLHTIRSYERHVALLGRWLIRERRSDALESIDYQTIARFLASDVARCARTGKQRRATTLNLLRSVLRTFFGYARDAGWVGSNPARLVRLARCAGPAPRGLTRDEQQRILGTLIVAQGPAARTDHLLVDTLLSTGIRLSAALALTDSDVDIERSELVVHHSKGDRVERVVMGTAIRDHVIGYLAERQPGPLFQGRDGQALSSRHAARRIGAWMERAGIRRVNVHQLRHSFALNLYAQTRDLLVVQRALGHASVSSTTAYARADSTAVRAALDRLCGGRSAPLVPARRLDRAP